MCLTVNFEHISSVFSNVYIFNFKHKIAWLDLLNTGKILSKFIVKIKARSINCCMLYREKTSLNISEIWLERNQWRSSYLFLTTSLKNSVEYLHKHILETEYNVWHVKILFKKDQ